MKLVIGLVLFVGVSFGAAAAELTPVAPVMECEQLKGIDLSGVADAPIHITEAVRVEDAKPAAYCKVAGYVEPQVRFEVHLPLTGWTQRFLETGCGGLCGNLNVRVSNANNCLPAKRGELVLAGTDMGHEGPGGSFGDDPQLRTDFAYRGVHVTALTAKAIIAKYYGRPAKYSYFAGCSDGGREALMEAQRYPTDFDGITAGAPAMNFITQNSFYHAWNARMNRDAEGKVILTADKLPILHAAAVAACDAVDGLKDGLINDPRACHFDPAVTLCKVGQDAQTCLTSAQVEVAKKIYQGAHDSEGHQLVISGPQVGSELAWQGVYIPKSPDQHVMSEQVSMDTIKHLLYPKPLPESYTLTDFHFDRQTFEAIKPMHALYDATNPDLTGFEKHGGKLILWHGWSDPHISPLNTIAYYSAIKQPQAFVRLYLFPGGYHCGGGDGPFDVDLLSPIMNWVENGKAPNELIAGHSAGRGMMDGPPPPRGAPMGLPPMGVPPMEAMPAPKVDRTRPVFPYPTVATYKGSGDINDAANFVGKAPTVQFKDQPDWLGADFYLPK